MQGLSFITLLAYDYKYAFKTIESYYEIADEIILGLDSQRLSWAGNPFYIDLPEVKRFINQYDKHNKVTILEDNFHVFSSANRNETAERNVLSLRCKPGNWIVQIDCDEILQNPLEFRSWIANIAEDVLVKAKWINVFKIFEEEGTCLVVDGATGGPNIATKKANSYIVRRRTKQRQLESPLKLLHFSWGRTIDELKQKLDNWGHKDDFDTKEFLKLWVSINLDNYHTFTNFHPLEKESWPKLKAIPITALSLNHDK